MILMFNRYKKRKGYGEAAHARSLTRAFAASMRKVWALMKAQTKTEHLALWIAEYTCICLEDDLHCFARER